MWLPISAISMSNTQPSYRTAFSRRSNIWSDGRVIFAKDPKKWDHNLLQGRIGAGSIAKLKEALEATRVFELKGN